MAMTPTKRERRSYLPEIQEEIRLREQLKKAALPTAAYCRLSNEDITEGSIETQIALVHDYIERNPELRLEETYTDNGMTGTSFDRPDWNRLMRDVREGRIRCIVVKDLSRFGRNFVEAGYYIESIFPKLNVRFIAINDDYDNTKEEDHEKIIISLKNVFNAEYAKELSYKLHISFSNMRRSGEVMGRIPFGYKKAETKKNSTGIKEPRQITSDPDTAGLVRMMFLWAKMDASVPQITRRLNLMTEKTPGTSQMWTESAVHSILTNPVYAGDLVSGKVLTNMHRKTVTSKDEWVVHKGHHEAIVDRATFDAVQSVIGKRRMAEHKRLYEKDPLEDVMFCASCGAKLRIERRGKNMNQRIFYCVNHTGLRPKVEQMACRPQAEAVKIRRTLTRNAKQYTDELRNVKILIDGAEKHGGVLDLLLHESALVLAEKKTIEENGIHLLDDFQAEVLDRETYLAAREKYKNLLKQKDTVLAELMSKQRQLTVKLEELKPFLKEKTAGSGMDSVRAIGMVERIHMKPNGRIIIIFRQKDNIRFVKELMNEMKQRSADREQC